MRKFSFLLSQKVVDASFFVTGEYTQKCIYLRTNAVSLLCNFSRSLPPTTIERTLLLRFSTGSSLILRLFFLYRFLTFWHVWNWPNFVLKFNEIWLYLCKIIERMILIYSKTHLRLNQRWMKNYTTMQFPIRQINWTVSVVHLSL